jgi:acetyl-CoA carboxylase beta subunit
MLVNQRYDYVNDFPLSQLELDALIDKRYGTKKYHVHDYKVDGFIKEGVITLVLKDSELDGGGIGEMVEGKVLVSVENGYEARIDNVLVESDNVNITIQVSLRSGEFIPGELVKIRDENTYAVVVTKELPETYTTTSNYDYEFALNESKRRIKIVDPALVEQLVKEFKDII